MDKHNNKFEKEDKKLWKNNKEYQHYSSIYENSFYLLPNGIEFDRGCTDIACFIIFAFFVLSLAMLTLYGY